VKGLGAAQTETLRAGLGYDVIVNPGVPFAIVKQVGAMTNVPYTPHTWHNQAFFGLHFDLHATERDTELGSEATYAHLRAELEKVKPDFVQYDCKGHPGYAGYPTKVGVPSPGVQKDALKVWRKVTEDMGIPLSVHYSGLWDIVQARLHPDWLRHKADGTSYGGLGFTVHPMSADSPYAEKLLIPQLIEAIDEYGIDGVWVDGDCWAAAPDWSTPMRKLFVDEMARRLGHFEVTDIPLRPGDQYWADYMAFNRQRFIAYVTRYAEALHAHKPGFAVCSNWAYTVRMPDDVTAPLDYLSGDTWWEMGLDNAQLEAKFMDGRGLPWDLMAWGFTAAGPAPNDNWTLKPAAHLQLEGALTVANGGAFWIYDQPARNGHLTGWHMDTFGEVAAFLRQRQEACQGTKSVPHVALLHSQSHFYATNHPEGTTSVFSVAVPARALAAALQVLLENHYHVDVLNEGALLSRMGEYAVIVVAEQTHLPQALKDALIAWVRHGGKLMLTGAQTAREFDPQTLGVTALGEPEQAAYHVPAGEGSVILRGEWLRAKPLTHARTLATLLPGEEMSERFADLVAATLVKCGGGSIATIYGPVMSMYRDYRYGRIREFFGRAMRALTGPMPVELDAPPWVQMVVRQKPEQLIVHLLNTSSANPLSQANPLIEEVPLVGPIALRVQVERLPRALTLSPVEATMDWSWRAGVVTAKLDRLHIHTALVIDL
jgi:hypothetical protein